MFELGILKNAVMKDTPYRAEIVLNGDYKICVNNPIWSNYSVLNGENKTIIYIYKKQ